MGSCFREIEAFSGPKKGCQLHSARKHCRCSFFVGVKPQKRCRRRARSFNARESFAGVAFWRALILPRRVLTQPIGGSIFEKALFCRGEASPWAPYLPTPGRYWVHPVRNLHQGEAFFGRPPGLGSRRSKVLILPRRVGGRNLQKMLNFPKQGPSSL